MGANLHLLATRLPGGALEASVLTFRTLRVGFPTARVMVWVNDVDPEARGAIIRAAAMVKAEVRELHRISHDVWISTLLDKADSPFWIADTDLVFWSAVEGFAAGHMAGRFEPEFVEQWSGTLHVQRLHTSLLFLDPNEIRRRLREWVNRWHPKGFPFAPLMEMVRQQYVPVDGHPPMFYDTCAGLYHAIGGKAFTAQQNAAFEHLHCGCYSHRINDALPGIQEVHAAIFQDVNAARGLQEQQNQFYQDHAILQ